MKFTKSQLRQLIKEELKGTIGKVLDQKISAARDDQTLESDYQTRLGTLIRKLIKEAAKTDIPDAQPQGREPREI